VTPKKVVRKAEPVMKECINWLEYLFDITQDRVYQMGIEQLNIALSEMKREEFLKGKSFSEGFESGGQVASVVQGDTSRNAKPTRNDSGNSFVTESDVSNGNDTLLQDFENLQMDALKSENEGLQNQIAAMANEMEMLQGALAEAKKEAEEWRVKYNSADDLPLKRSQETPTESAEPTKAEDGSKLMVLLQDAKKESEDWKKKYEKLKGYIELGQELGIMKQ
jgi:hypothetical protein